MSQRVRHALSVVVDLTADFVFLVVQRALLLPGNMSVILRGHVTFFVPDLVVFMMEFRGLRPAHPAVVHLPVDAGVLIVEAGVHLRAPGMGLRESAGLGERVVCKGDTAGQ